MRTCDCLGCFFFFITQIIKPRGTPKFAKASHLYIPTTLLPKTKDFEENINSITPTAYSRGSHGVHYWSVSFGYLHVHWTIVFVLPPEML
jgi:hypothetical protein